MAFDLAHEMHKSLTDHLLVFISFFYTYPFMSSIPEFQNRYDRFPKMGAIPISSSILAWDFP